MGVNRRNPFFWDTFNDWARNVHESSGRKPRVQMIKEWFDEHASTVWPDASSRPTFLETKRHAKGVRSKENIKAYFRRYRLQRKPRRRDCQGTGSDVSEDEDAGSHGDESAGADPAEAESNEEEDNDDDGATARATALRKRPRRKPKRLCSESESDSKSEESGSAPSSGGDPSADEDGDGEVRVSALASRDETRRGRKTNRPDPKSAATVAGGVASANVAAVGVKAAARPRQAAKGTGAVGVIVIAGMAATAGAAATTGKAGLAAMPMPAAAVPKPATAAAMPKPAVVTVAAGLALKSAAAAVAAPKPVAAAAAMAGVPVPAAAAAAMADSPHPTALRLRRRVTQQAKEQQQHDVQETDVPTMHNPQSQRTGKKEANSPPSGRHRSPESRKRLKRVSIANGPPSSAPQTSLFKVPSSATAGTAVSLMAPPSLPAGPATRRRSRQASAGAAGPWGVAPAPVDVPQSAGEAVKAAAEPTAGGLSEERLIDPRERAACVAAAILLNSSNKAVAPPPPLRPALNNINPNASIAMPNVGSGANPAAAHLARPPSLDNLAGLATIASYEHANNNLLSGALVRGASPLSEQDALYYMIRDLSGTGMTAADLAAGGLPCDPQATTGVTAPPSSTGASPALLPAPPLPTSLLGNALANNTSNHTATRKRVASNDGSRGFGSGGRGFSSGGGGDGSSKGGGGAAGAGTSMPPPRQRAVRFSIEGPGFGFGAAGAGGGAPGACDDGGFVPPTLRGASRAVASVDPRSAPSAGPVPGTVHAAGAGSGVPSATPGQQRRRRKSATGAQQASDVLEESDFPDLGGMGAIPNSIMRLAGLVGATPRALATGQSIRQATADWNDWNDPTNDAPDVGAYEQFASDQQGGPFDYGYGYLGGGVGEQGYQLGGAQPPFIKQEEPEEQGGMGMCMPMAAPRSGVTLEEGAGAGQVYGMMQQPQIGQAQEQLQQDLRQQYQQQLQQPVMAPLVPPGALPAPYVPFGFPNNPNEGGLDGLGVGLDGLNGLEGLNGLGALNSLGGLAGLAGLGDLGSLARFGGLGGVGGGLGLSLSLANLTSLESLNMQSFCPQLTGSNLAACFPYNNTAALFSTAAAQYMVPSGGGMDLGGAAAAAASAAATAAASAVASMAAAARQHHTALAPGGALHDRVRASRDSAGGGAGGGLQ